MSEEKIIEHAHNAVHIAGDKQKTWSHKIRELAEEVLIIIFAVSITLAFHNWNDWRNERKIEREFLTGISSDLKRAANNLDAGNKYDLGKTAEYYDKVWEQIKRNKIDAAYVDSNSYQLENTAYFVFDNGRFEGFKSSGYLRLIENQTLLKDITTLYSVAIPFQIRADDLVYGDRKKSFYDAIGTKAPIDTNEVVHVSKIINDPAVKFQIVYYGRYMHERIRQKAQLAAEMRKVAAEIDEELKK